MGAIVNGIALEPAMLSPYGSTFLIFSDYMRPSVRLSALMGLPSVWVWTHDSVAVGEDGPTHQPVEHHMALRTIPNLWYIRPADANETAMAWRIAVERTDGPVALALSRQKLPTFDRAELGSADGTLRGAYTLWQRGEGEPDAIVVATGSEVHVALDGAQQVDANIRVVSMPCWELFESQGADYIASRSFRLGCPACRSRPASRSVGAAGPGRASGSTATAPLLPTSGCSRSTASPPPRLPPPSRHSSHEGRRRVRSSRRLASQERARLDQGSGSHPRGSRRERRRRSASTIPTSRENVAMAIRSGRAERGVLVCGSGVGASVAASKIPGIRAAVCHDTFSAHQGVEHDDMNVLCLGSGDHRRLRRRGADRRLPRRPVRRRGPLSDSTQEGRETGEDRRWLKPVCRSCPRPA